MLCSSPLSNKSQASHRVMKMPVNKMVLIRQHPSGDLCSAMDSNGQRSTKKKNQNKKNSYSPFFGEKGHEIKIPQEQESKVALLF